MENEPKIVKLNDMQKREILGIFINGIGSREPQMVTKDKMKKKLELFLKGDYQESDFNTIYRDCQMYVTVNNMFYRGKNYNPTKIIFKDKAKSVVYSVVKRYLVEKYLSTDVEQLEIDGTINKIVTGFLEAYPTVDNIQDNAILNHMAYYLQKLQIYLSRAKNVDMYRQEQTSQIQSEHVKMILSDIGTYERFIARYVRDLIQRERFEVSTEQLESEMREDGLSNIGSKLERSRRMNMIRQKVLVPNAMAKEFLSNPRNSQRLAEEYVYKDGPDSQRRIENSLVEDKLLTIYLETRSKFDV